MKMDNDIIESFDYTNCLLCSSTGKQLYKDMPDGLFGSKGRWTLSQCSNKQCELIWLNPCPTQNDIYKAYHKYFFHGTQDREECCTLHQWLLQIFHFIKLASFSRLPLKYMFLAKVPPGRVLDIGCGNGRTLQLLKTKGWQIIGQEVDPVSAAIAQKRLQCKIYTQKLPDIHFPDNSFDAVVMNHVIEHIHDPIDILKECRRILKPKGKLISVTPNAKSILHKIFQESWLGLDPPRHIHIFSVKNYKTLAEKAGFESIRYWTTMANAINCCWLSLEIKHKNPYPVERPTLQNAIRAFFLKPFSALSLLLNKDSGDEIILIAEK